MFYEAPVRQKELDQIWRPYYHLVKLMEPVTFKVWDHLRNKVKRTHSNDLKRTPTEEWGILEVTEKRRPILQATLAGSSCDMEDDSETEIEIV